MMMLNNFPAITGRSGATASVLVSKRLFGIRRRRELEDPSKFHPNDTIDAVKPPHYWVEPPPDAPEPMMYIRKPVTSASAVDLTSKVPKLSVADTVSLTADGTVRHGRYGILPRSAVENIPLEYLTLLHPSAQAAAALRIIMGHPSNQSIAGTGGTLVVYGASQPAGLAATQLAASSSLAVIAVVDAQHSGEPEMIDCVKGMAPYPGTAVPEEFAAVKRGFYDLVSATALGEKPTKYDCSNDFLVDFLDNLKAYADFFPSEKGAATDPSLWEFNGKEKDRATFTDNMEAYLEQFPKGVPALPPKEEIIAKFGPDVYAVYKSRYGIHTSASITFDSDIPEFDPAGLVKTLMYTPTEEVKKELTLHSTNYSGSSSKFIPFRFDVLNPICEEEFKGAGPVVGAIVVATPTLVKACERVAKGKTLREKAEALQFLTQMEKKAFAAASAVFTVAKKAGKDVLVVGGMSNFYLLMISRPHFQASSSSSTPLFFLSLCFFCLILFVVLEYSLPGQQSVELKTEDVHTALSAMEIQDDGSSQLNFFIQVYRAGDFPVYENYAIHRAMEPLSGPRQIIVTK
jgi:hypothetical protein